MDENKNTFVRLYGLEKCEQLVCEYTQRAIDALAVFENADFLTDLAKKMSKRFS